MERALLHQLRTGTDRAMRDALLLEDAMKGMGTEDRLLVNRVIRVHWDRNHMMQVKGAYQHRFHKSVTSYVLFPLFFFYGRQSSELSRSLDMETDEIRFWAGS